MYYFLSESYILMLYFFVVSQEKHNHDTDFLNKAQIVSKSCGCKQIQGFPSYLLLTYSMIITSPPVLPILRQVLAR